MCSLNYSNIDKNFTLVLKYCLKASDTFSVITNLKKRHSNNSLICEHDEAMRAWASCMIRQDVGVKAWPGTETKDTHKVMTVYSARKFRTASFDLPNFFSPMENRLPEDICFYRNDTAWFCTISHEKTAFMQNATKEDVQFFQTLHALK